MELTAPELLRILDFIAAEFNDQERLALAERVRELDEASRGAGWEERQALRRPCPLLVDGRCSVYEVRPLACRGWNSMDAEECRHALENPGSTVTFIGDLSKITNSVWAGLLQALELSDFKGGVLELVAALRIGLEVADADARWFRGERVFQEAQSAEFKVAEPRQPL